ncbi:hypothetical protein SEA_ADNAMA_123 [Mycobacterium phage Adnama]|uniref:Uncharacterized protein n=10 Tax=Viruses TaxID=10239 RepID=G1DI52_9CAUD|nr:hypothetical protein M039_gp135 [Mycobacterium phage Phaux]YP_008409514.1 hypothetical protein DRDREY_123 [Mycobacterium phage DrDrey]YP_009011877.1 hypothetical protein LILAC_120 [Mycobacterium phage Lilac]YP_009197782.1 hypothetical protein SEA_NELITZAMV_116 [Mycobacterium phage NelitzaMV]YP_009208524.1 hypothetical protein SEA_TOTO_118 [Mycobacterium phage Toto]YP_009225407.1 hypothetical protein SEA_MINDY_122 [Mycobacterium phage Mindy]YP_009613740.1 hypothetical protein FDI54_gp133 [M
MTTKRSKSGWAIRKEENNFGAPGKSWFMIGPDGRKKWCPSWEFALIMLPLEQTYHFITDMKTIEEPTTWTANSSPSTSRPMTLS